MDTRKVPSSTIEALKTYLLRLAKMRENFSSSVHSYFIIYVNTCAKEKSVSFGMFESKVSIPIVHGDCHRSHLTNEL